MTTHSETLLSEFIDAWNAGERPDAEEFLARAAEADREELGSEIHTFLELAPTPAYSDAARADIEADPRAREAIKLASNPEDWPTLLPALRRQARVRRDELVGLLALHLGVAGRVRKVGRYYHGMEAGTLEPAGVSTRVLDALATLLDVSRERLEAAGRATVTGAVSAESEVYSRSYEVERSVADALADALAGDIVMPGEFMGPLARPKHRHATSRDEVDMLFTGGR